MDFLKDYSRIGYLLISLLFAGLLWMAQQAVSNNTKAMDRLTEKIDTFAEQQSELSSRQATNMFRLEQCEKRLDKGGF